MPDEHNSKLKGGLTDTVGDFSVPTDAFRKMPNPAESFGTVPPISETFGNLPNNTATFRVVPHASEPSAPTDWRESYTLTVREVARLFETAGVARSERSIVNWCQRNRQGIARLDAYFDPNERRYFITRQSVDSIIAEEQARASKTSAHPIPAPAEEIEAEAKQAPETFRTTPNPSEATQPEMHGEVQQLSELRRENIDLKINNRAKDYFIEQLKEEREGLLKQVVDSSHRVGHLEARLLQLGESSPIKTPEQLT